MTLTHKPTGLSVSREIPSGHYTKKEMRDQRERTKEELFVELAALLKAQKKGGK